MTGQRPTGSVTGHAGWRWNPEADSTASTAQQHRDRREITTVTATADNRIERGEVDVQRAHELRLALARKDRQLQQVIERYESLLAERNQRLTERRQSEQTDGLLMHLWQHVRRLVSDTG